MASTVITAFNEFMKDTVNLRKADTDDARTSRDWLIGKMSDFEKDDVFPVSHPGICVFRSVRSRIGIEVRSRIGTEVRSGFRLHSVNRDELTFSTAF